MLGNLIGCPPIMDIEMGQGSAEAVVGAAWAALRAVSRPAYASGEPRRLAFSAPAHGQRSDNSLYAYGKYGYLPRAPKRA